MILVEHRFVVKEILLGRATSLEEVDDPLRFCRMVGPDHARLLHLAVCESGQERGQCQRSETLSRASEKLPTGEAKQGTDRMVRVVREQGVLVYNGIDVR